MPYHKLTLVLLLCAFFLSIKSAAQSAEEWYQFESLQETYQPLEAPISLNPGIDYPGHDNYTVALGFEFRFFEQAIHSIRVQRNGIVHTGTEGEFIAPFRPTLAITPQSRVSYQISSPSPCQHRILKVEWRNMALICQDSLVGELSFQLWLYEGRDRIELHYGPQLNASPTEDCEANRWSILGPRLRLERNGPYALVIGSFEQPTLLPSTGSLNGSTHDFQRGIPPPGTVYRFIPTTFDREAPFIVGPNPSTGVLTIQSFASDCEPLRLTLADLWGRVYLQAETTASNVPLDLSGYRPGWYLLRLYHPVSEEYHVVKLLLLE